MISDDQLYSLAIFLGCMSMLLIVLYHFLEVNAKPDGVTNITPGSEKSSQANTTSAEQGTKGEKGATKAVVS
ncbi:MAG: hypothetical protein Q9224_001948 [Gallowayella concinna]